jgi:hypothetical protein
MAQSANQTFSQKLLLVLVAAFALIGVGFLLYSNAAEGDWSDYPDNHPEITYSALKSGCDNFSSEGWALCTGQSGYFDDSYHYTNNIGQSMTFTFNGTGVRIYSDTSEHAGIMDVTIDDVPAGQIDYYTADFLKQVKVYEKTGLEPGNHVFKAVLVDKNTLSSGTFVGVDQVSIQGTIGEGEEPSPSPSLTPEPSPSDSPSPSPDPTINPTTNPSPSPNPDDYDANIDGQQGVGVGDLTIIITNYGMVDAQRTDGDLDGDGRVGVLDLSRLIKRWGKDR